MRKKFNMGKQFKSLYLLMILIMTAGLTGCGGIELTSETINLELGEKLSEDVKDYVTAKNEEAYVQMQLDISGVDQSTPGTYAASIVYDGKAYEFEVVVADTKAPELICVDYLITKSGTVKAEDVVTALSDASAASVGFKVTKTGELDAVSETVISNEKAVTGTEVQYVEDELADEIALLEEGCYQVTAVATDSYDHATVVMFHAYVDDTAPVLEQTATEVTVDAAAIKVDELEFDDKADKLEVVTELLHALPEFADMKFVNYTDNLGQDEIIILEYEQIAFNVTGENPVETLKYTCIAEDVAGNVSEEVTYELKVTYTNLDAAKLAKKAGLNAISGGNAYTYSGDPDVPVDGMTYAEYEAWILAMSEAEMNFYASYVDKGKDVLYYDKTTGEVISKVTGETIGHSVKSDFESVSYYYDATMAQEVFNLVNEERAANGLAALTWDSEMASYSDRRAQELVTDYSHNSAGGNLPVGENIATYYVSAQDVMDAWMASAGHKANILKASSTLISVSCYIEVTTHINGAVTYQYYWVQNFK